MKGVAPRPFAAFVVQSNFVVGPDRADDDHARLETRLTRPKPLFGIARLHRLLTVLGLAETMLTTLTHVLPILFPSWRFFKTVEPSPRVEWAVCDASGDTPSTWQIFRPAPEHVSVWQMVGRLFWNPTRNEALFLVSCADRIQHGPSPHSVAVISGMLRAHLAAARDILPGDMFQFRLVFIYMIGTDIQRDVVFVSDPFALLEPGA